MKKVILIIGMLISFLNLSAQNSDPSQVKFVFESDSSYISTEQGGNFYKNTFFRGWHWDSRASISTGLFMNQNHIYDWNNYNGDIDKPTINDDVNLFIVSKQAYDPTGPKYFDKNDTTITIILDSIIVRDTLINGNIVQLRDSITHSDTTLTPRYSNFKDEIPLFVDHNFYALDKEYYTLLNARSVQYEPTLEVKDLNNIPAIAAECTGGHKNSVFGFSKIHNNAIKNEGWLELYSSNFTDTSVVVLDSNYFYPLEKYRYFIIEKIGLHGMPKAENKLSKAFINGYNGNYYNLSINLKGLGNYSSIPENRQILKLEMEYETTSGTKGICVFDTKPGDRFVDLPKNRGKVLIDTLADDQDYYSLSIKKSMLPADNEPITITGRCNFLGGINQKNNPDKIKSLKIKATYYKNSGVNVAIDWVRIETPNAQRLFRGVLDSAIKGKVQTNINVYRFSDSANTKNSKYFREMTATETAPQYWGAERYFNQLVGNISSGAEAADMPYLYEVYVKPAQHWYELYKMHSRVNAPFMVKAPHSEYRLRSLGVAAGYAEYRKQDTLISFSLEEQLNSEYETYLNNMINIWKIPNGWGSKYYNSSSCTIRDFIRNYTNEHKDDLDFYKQDVYLLLSFLGDNHHTRSVQAYWDAQMYCNFYSPIRRGYLYSDLPWWGHSQIHVSLQIPYFQKKDGWGFDFKNTDTSIDLSKIIDSCKTYLTDSTSRIYATKINEEYQRQITGEEMRLLDNSIIIMGGKGLFYDGAFGNGQVENGTNVLKLIDIYADRAKYPNSFDRNTYNLDYIIDDDIGTDFVDFTPNVSFTPDTNSKDSYIDEHINSNFYGIINDPVYKYNQCQTYMGVDTSRIYLGRRSQRLELYKIHKWTQENDSTLMKLRLIAWKGKGFMDLYNQHPELEEASYMSRFINLDGIRTQKVAQPLLSGGYTTPNLPFEADTAQFYDVTLLKFNESEMKDSLVIGVQNRRTDPLLWRTINGENKINFFSTAELDVLCDNGGADPFNSSQTYNANYWKALFTKRLGCRYIYIPLHIFDENGIVDSLKIEELGYNMPSDTNLYNAEPYWKRWYDQTKINQQIANHTDLKDIFLPGQGSMYKIKPIFVNNYLKLKESNDSLSSIDSCTKLKNAFKIYAVKDNSNKNDCNYSLYIKNLNDSVYIRPLIQLPLDSNFKVLELSSNVMGYVGKDYLNIYPTEYYDWDSLYVGKLEIKCGELPDLKNLVFTYGLPHRCEQKDTISLVCEKCECCDDLNFNVSHIISPSQNCDPFACNWDAIISQTQVEIGTPDCLYDSLKIIGTYSFDTDNPDTLISQSLNMLPLQSDPTMVGEIIRIHKPIIDFIWTGTFSYCYKLKLFSNGIEVCEKLRCVTFTQNGPDSNIVIDASTALSGACICNESIPKIGTNTKDDDFMNLLILTPNPTKTNLEVSIYSSKTETATLTIYDLNGKAILNAYEGTLKQGGNSLQINCQDLPNGVYNIMLQTGSQRLTKKFVVER